MMYYFLLCKYCLFIVWMDCVQWQSNFVYLQVWQEGKMGYLIVDVVMCQFNSIGWMYNWLWMIIVSFLVKDLLIDWCEGE